MTEGNKQFIKAVLVLLGINIFMNILPYPYGILTFVGFTLYFLWDLYKQTRY